jgi:hypothetical protein
MLLAAAPAQCPKAHFEALAPFFCACGMLMRSNDAGNGWADAEILPDLLQHIDADIEQVSAEVTYDTSDCYDAIAQRDAKPTIPPRKNAVIWHHGNCKAPPHPRDENLRSIHKHGRKKWKQRANDHHCSLAETTMLPHKTAFAGKVRTCKFDNQYPELLSQWAILNRMIQLGKPNSVPIAA